MKDSLCGLSDLVDLLQAGRTDLLPAMAELIGYEDKGTKPKTADKVQTPTLTITETDPSTTKVNKAVTQLAPVPFWQVTEYESFQALQHESTPSGAKITSVDRLPKADWPTELPDHTPLSQWRDLVPRLRCTVSEIRSGRALDPKTIVKRLSRARFLNSIPRKHRRRWGQQAQIIVDKSRRLTPYWRDQLQLCHQLLDVFPKGALTFGRYWDGMEAPVLSHQGAGKTYSFPQPGTLVLVLSDLGCLSADGRSMAFWRCFGQALRDHDCRPVAMLPSESACSDNRIKRIWTVCAWEQAAADNRPGPKDLTEQTQALLTLLSPAIRIEPELLRAMRRQVLQANACVEALAWQHTAIASGSSTSFHLNFRI